MTDNKTSLLIKRQIPEFIREEYPRFVSFVEAYYEFLDSSMYDKAKQLNYVSDVDVVLEEFEQHFFNTFLPFVPRDAKVNKDLLIKNILPLYLSKGSEKSYQLLFRMLFDENIKVEYPGRQILRASDGRWKVETLIRAETEVYSQYFSDGEQTVYYVPYVMEGNLVSVYVDDVLVTNYQYRKEYRKIIFAEAPSEHSVIKIIYDLFNIQILNNRKIAGQTSGASAIVEKSGKRNVGGLNFFQLFINKKTTLGNFSNGELLYTDVIVDGLLIPIYLKAYSDVQSITIVDGGSSYNIGDPVIVRGVYDNPVKAQVSQVTSGVIDELIVIDGGVGFSVDDLVFANNISNTFFQASVVTVDDSGIVSSNSISYNTDIINDYANVSIDSLDYGFPSTVVPTENVDTVIANALSSNTIINLGSITLTNVETSIISSNSNPTFYAVPKTLYDDVKISDLGIIGKISIIDGGVDYEIGDKLIFINEPMAGYGANAVVSNVSVTGAITQITINSGGMYYSFDNLPTIQVDSLAGANANLQVTGIMGTGADFGYDIAGDVKGRILSIRILDSGSGFLDTPLVDLTRSGDGNATAYANLNLSISQLEGKWETSDSILSSDEIKLQGRDYYIDYAYVISSKVEFDKYKSILKNLLHPAGFANYAKLSVVENVDSQVVNIVDSVVKLQPSGTVNIQNNSNTVVGVNTNFVIANTIGIMPINTKIAINDEVREIISIEDTDALTVNANFTTTSNNQLITILT